MKLNASFDGNLLKVKDPETGETKIAGKRVYLKSSRINDKEVYLGEYTESFESSKKLKEAILITRTIQTKDFIILKKGRFIKHHTLFLMSPMKNFHSCID